MARRIRWQLVIAVLSVCLVGVLVGSVALSQTVISEPLRGGVAIELVSAPPQQLNPLLNDPLRDPTGRDISALIFEGLMRLNDDGQPVGALAERWQIDQSGTVYTFHLADGHTWHDGVAVTADDVIFTLRMLQEEPLASNSANGALWRDVLVERLDDRTIRCTLRAPYAPFLAMARVPIVPQHLLANIPPTDWAQSPFAQHPIGSGPFRFVEQTSNYVRLEANTAHPTRVPFIEQLELQFLAAPEMSISALVRGEAHLLGMPTLVAPELQRITLPDTIRRFHMPLDSSVLLSFNLRRPPFDATPMRQALALGLDKDVIIDDTLQGHAFRLDSPIILGWWAHDSSIDMPAYDPATARTLLAQHAQRESAPWRSLELLTDTDPTHRAVANAVAQQWRSMGLTIEVRSLAPATLQQRLQDHDFDMAIHGWSRLGPDPDMVELWHSSHAEHGLNYAGLMDGTIDDLLISGQRHHDRGQRIRDYSAFQSRWLELTPAIMLYQPSYTMLVHQDLQGIQVSPSSVAHGLLIGQEARYQRVNDWFLYSSREIRTTFP